MGFTRFPQLLLVVVETRGTVVLPLDKVLPAGSSKAVCIHVGALCRQAFGLLYDHRRWSGSRCLSEWHAWVESFNKYSKVLPSRFDCSQTKYSKCRGFPFGSVICGRIASCTELS